MQDPTTRSNGSQSPGPHAQAHKADIFKRLQWASGAEISPGAKSLLFVLVRFANRAGWARPSQRTLAKMCGRKERMIRYYLAELVAADLIEIKTRRLRRKRYVVANEYRILSPDVERQSIAGPNQIEEKAIRTGNGLPRKKPSRKSAISSSSSSSSSRNFAENFSANPKRPNPRKARNGSGPVRPGTDPSPGRGDPRTGGSPPPSEGKRSAGIEGEDQEDRNDDASKDLNRQSIAASDSAAISTPFFRPGVSLDSLSLSLAQAREIVQDARSFDFTDEPMADDDADLIEQAERLIACAAECWQSGDDSPNVLMIQRQVHNAVSESRRAA